MNSSKQAAEKQWVSVYKQELKRRRVILRKDPKLYEKKFKCNMKNVTEACCSKGHVWVPATHLWIHDGGKKGSYSLFGYPRRSFREASPYRDGDHIIVPKVCWNCIKVTELIRDVLSHKERDAIRVMRAKESGIKKQRGRKPKYTVAIDADTSIEEILG